MYIIRERVQDTGEVYYYGRDFEDVSGESGELDPEKAMRLGYRTEKQAAAGARGVSYGNRRLHRGTVWYDILRVEKA